MIRKDVPRMHADAGGRRNPGRATQPHRSKAGMSSRLEILTFHRILPEGESYFIPPMAMSVGIFSRLLRSLKRHYQILPLREAIRAFSGGGPRRPAVALTFDDGYADNLHLARAILLKEGLPATFFIPVTPVRDGSAYWWDRLFHVARQRTGEFHEFLGPWAQRLGLGPLQVVREPADVQAVGCLCRKVVAALNGAGRAVRDIFLGQLEARFGAYDGPGLLMSMADARTLVRDGFEVGSHSMSHAPLTDLSLPEAVAELRDSKACLESDLGCPVQGFSYPRGAYTSDIARQARDAGYAYAVTTRFGSNSLGASAHELARRNMSDYRGLRARFPIPMHMLEISGRLDPLLANRR